MGLINAITGAASELDPEKLQEEFAPILASDESITQAYKLIRDVMVFTQKRLILVDRQGLTGKKVEYHSIPYRSISQFSVETAGTFDMDAELKLWVGSVQTPEVISFRKSRHIRDIQKLLATNVL
jgi:hypothetical protein